LLQSGCIERGGGGWQLSGRDKDTNKQAEKGKFSQEKGKDSNIPMKKKSMEEWREERGRIRKGAES